MTALAILAPTGCSGHSNTPGALQARSLGIEPVVLPGYYTTAVYAHEPEGDTRFLLTDIPLKDLLSGNVINGQAMHIELLWTPRAGKTPMDADATNISIRHIIVSDGEVGLYGGAGFALLSGQPGCQTLKLSVRDASTRLIESTDNFNDLLSPAQLTGSFAAKLDPKEAQRVYRALSQFVTNATGRSRLVKIEESPAIASTGLLIR